MSRRSLPDAGHARRNRRSTLWRIARAPIDDFAEESVAGGDAGSIRGGPVRFSITARDGRERGRDVDVLLDADPDDQLVDVLAPVVGALGDQMHPSFLAHVPVWVD